MEMHLEKAIDAQRMPLQRTQGRTKESGVLVLGLMAAMLLLAQPGHAAVGDGGAGLSGVVRDAQGVVQMGALVQVLTANSRTVATAFTDQHGRYMIAGLLPGKYQIKASAALFVPATKANLQLQGGARAVVDLTLAALFDTASWLPASRRRADEPDDSWKWTLRSTANRPILRMDDDGSVLVVSGVPEGSKANRIEARGAVMGEAGEFGESEIQTQLALHEAFANGALSTMLAEIGSDGLAGLGGASPSVEVDAEYERANPYGGGSRVAMSYGSHPGLVGSNGAAGLEVLRIQSGQQMALGENVELEVGGSLEGVRGSDFALAAHPFVRLTAHPGGSWKLQYRMATSRQTQEFADLNVRHEGTPTAIENDGRMSLEAGRHQEFSASHKAGRAVVEVAYYHDAMQNTSVSGGLGAEHTASTTAVSSGLDGLLLDPASGTFRTLGVGYTSDGARVTVSVPMAKDIWIAAEYATGDALDSEAQRPASVAEAVAGLKPVSSQAAAIAVRGKSAWTGTSVRASYRWQPEATVTAVDPYGALSDQAYLSCVVRQHLQWKDHLPQGLDATIDVTNLLAQGYRPFLSADGRTLYFAQAPRSIQAGLSFTF